MRRSRLIGGFFHCGDVLRLAWRRRSAVAEDKGEFVMTIKTFFAIFAVLSVLFGIGFVLAPGQVLINYGVESTPAVALMSRLFGGTLLAMAVILWSAREFRDDALRAVLVGFGFADAVNFVIALVATSSGTINALGWTTVLIYLCGAAGSAYFLTTGSVQQSVTKA
jgi:hypothetical protein